MHRYLWGPIMSQAKNKLVLQISFSSLCECEQCHKTTRVDGMRADSKSEVGHIAFNKWNGISLPASRRGTEFHGTEFQGTDTYRDCMSTSVRNDVRIVNKLCAFHYESHTLLPNPPEMGLFSFQEEGGRRAGRNFRLAAVTSNERSFQAL